MVTWSGFVLTGAMEIYSGEGKTDCQQISNSGKHARRQDAGVSSRARRAHPQGQGPLRHKPPTPYGTGMEAGM